MQARAVPEIIQRDETLNKEAVRSAPTSLRDFGLRASVILVDVRDVLQDLGAALAKISNAPHANWRLSRSPQPLRSTELVSHKQEKALIQ